MPRTLQPEDRIAHYRVVGPLAAGGMGEVYIAQDQKLDRSVALKILPPNLVKNEERVRRFVTEAKSASSLSHPHIVTIYEIGHDHVRPAGTDDPAAGTAADTATPEPDSEPVHYISMELVTGETLKDKIHHEKTDLRTLLGYLVQAAEGLANAHASGIVHRDLKPSNIMISRDGYAKVLDFGLAKLTERESAVGPAHEPVDPTSAATEIADATGEGVVLGTVGYMSPEQVRGKSVDHRSDIFSFGCILYEAATRRRPFAADSDVETMHQILNVQPSAVEELSPEVPNAIRRLIRRCLAKNADQRLQSMKDLAIELQEIVDEYDSLAPSGSSSGIQPPPAASARRHLPLAAVAAIVVLGLAGMSLGLWTILRGGPTDPAAPPATRPAPFQTMRMASLVSAENLGGAVLSADGRYLAYISGLAGERSLDVRQVATGSEVRLAGPLTSIDGVSFSPDASYVFFLRRDPDTPNYRALFSVPSLGGAPRKRVFDVDSAVSLSPDGTRVCFQRGMPQHGKDALIVADLDTANETMLATVDEPADFLPPAWSPDGTRIAAAVFHLAGGVRSELLSLDPETGEAETLAETGRLILRNIAWLPDGRTLVASGTEPGYLAANQIWLFPTDGGGPRRVTNDLNDYTGVSVGEAGAAISAIRTSITANLWTVPADAAHGMRQITFGVGSAEAVRQFRVAPDGTLVFIAQDAGASHLWSVRADGSGRRRITPGGDNHYAPTRIRGGHAVLGRAGEELVPHIWRQDLDGGAPVQLTHGTGEFPVDTSPDGTTFLFTKTEEISDVWQMPVAGGEEQRVATGASQGFIQYSPDGRWIVYRRLVEIDDRAVPESVIAPSGGGDPIGTMLNPPGAFGHEWAPSGAALTYCLAVDGVGNVYRSSVEEPEPAPLTRFEEGQVLSHEWSPDDTRMVVSRRLGSSVGLWVVRVADGTVTQLASFATGQLFDVDWAPDGQSLIFSHGAESRDVVVIRDFH